MQMSGQIVKLNLSLRRGMQIPHRRLTRYLLSRPTRVFKWSRHAG
jgi:hypothetical protein